MASNPGVEEQFKYFYDVWGTDKTYNHMAVPWAWAFDTPFSWTKQIASHFGGIRQGMCISWPQVIKDQGGIRNQFHHVIDITPTILEAAGIRQPEVVDGIKQSPIEGVSMMYTFDKKNAEAPSTAQDAVFRDDRRPRHLPRRLDRQHESHASALGKLGAEDEPAPSILGSCTTSGMTGPSRRTLPPSFRTNLKKCRHCFGRKPRSTRCCRWIISVATRIITPRPSITAGRNVFTWTRPLTGTPNGDAPSILNASYNFKAEVEIPPGGAEGMLITQGGRFGGYGFYLLKGKPVFLWNLLDLKRIRWEGPELARGNHVLEFDFKYEGLGRHPGV